MKSLSGVGLGLSLVFGCLFFALVLELYYLLWRKNRFTGAEIEDDYRTELFYMFCCKSSSSSSSQTAINPRSLVSDEPGTEFQIQSKKDFLLKPFGEDGIESEFLRLQNLSGPPRFLFPITEETKEDLESDDGKGSKSKSLSDLLFTVETPFLTPLTSPTLFTPMDSSYSNQKFNPLFESASDAEFNKIRSSPPPKFKFLLDAEEKLRRKVMEEAEKQKSIHKYEEEEEQQQQQSYITIVVDHNNARDLNHHHSSNFQVLPLSSPPSAKLNLI